MQASLSSELRSVIEARLRRASPRQVLAIVSALCDEEAGQAAIAPIGTGVDSRFSVDGDTVRDTLTGLIWTRETLAGGRRKWTEAQKVAAECHVGGFTDWRLPTIQELLSIVEYGRTEPAINVSVFQCESAWYWSSTPVASSPSFCAWFVSFGFGVSSWDFQYGECFVRAVRPGQIVGHLG